MATDPTTEQDAPSPPIKLTGEQRKQLRNLVQVVARSFYEPKYIVIMDQLCKHDFIKDEDLWSRIGSSSKDGAKLVARISNDGLVSTHSQNEQKDPSAMRSTTRRYFYIDYKHFSNVVKWRMAQMRRNIDSRQRNELAYKGYICMNCKATYSLLDAQELLDPEQNVLICSVCQTVVTDNDDAGEAGKDTMQRFNAQTQKIRDCLRDVETIVFPPFDVVDLIRKQAAAAAAEAAREAGGDGLAIAGSGPGSGHTQKFSVEILQDADNEARRQEKETEASLRRQQNALPEWHTHSTVTGERTAFGATNNTTIPFTNGTSGSPFEHDDSKTDVKSQKDHVIDDYYALLPITSNEESVAPSPYSDGDVELESNYSLGVVDRKGKRRRNDAEIDEIPSGRSSKSAKYGPSSPRSRYSSQSATSTPNGNGSLPLESQTPEGNIDTPSESADDPVVYVQGTPVPYSQVTEEHHELMTPEEYEAFVNIMTSLSG